MYVCKYILNNMFVLTPWQSILLIVSEKQNVLITSSVPLRTRSFPFSLNTPRTSKPSLQGGAELPKYLDNNYFSSFSQRGTKLRPGQSIALFIHTEGNFCTTPAQSEIQGRRQLPHKAETSARAARFLEVTAKIARQAPPPRDSFPFHWWTSLFSSLLLWLFSFRNNSCDIFVCGRHGESLLYSYRVALNQIWTLR